MESQRQKFKNYISSRIKQWNWKEDEVFPHFNIERKWKKLQMESKKWGVDMFEYNFFSGCLIIKGNWVDENVNFNILLCPIKDEKIKKVMWKWENL